MCEALTEKRMAMLCAVRRCQPTVFRFALWRTAFSPRVLDAFSDEPKPILPHNTCSSVHPLYFQDDPGLGNTEYGDLEDRWLVLWKLTIHDIVYCYPRIVAEVPFRRLTDVATSRCAQTSSPLPIDSVAYSGFGRVTVSSGNGR
jgi:hypothetical protein